MGDNRRTLILVAAVVTLGCVTLAATAAITYYATHPGDGYDGHSAASPVVLIGSATAFGLVSINQLLGMLRGHLADKHADAGREQIIQTLDQRLNGELDRRITSAVTRAVAARMDETCGKVDEIAAEMHKMKHDIRGLHNTHRMMEELLEIASGHRAESIARDRRHFPPPAAPPETPPPGGTPGAD